MKFFWSLLMGLWLVAFGSAQPIGGPRTFPQFRDMAGLSGNGFGVTPEGEISLSGALTLSTPIAYTLRPGVMIAGGASRSFDRQFRWINTKFASNTERSDGTIQLLGALDSKWGAITFTHMIVSPDYDSVQHVQWTAPQGDTDWRFSFGIHNITNRPSANGDDNPVQDAKMSRSFFVVGTLDMLNESYFSVGLGTTRYRPVFGSYSGMLTSGIRYYGEYDSFNWNYGIATEFAVGSKKAFVSLGFVRGDLATWTINFTF
jgi:hypothetical protein